MNKINAWDIFTKVIKDDEDLKFNIEFEVDLKELKNATDEELSDFISKLEKTLGISVLTKLLIEHYSLNH